MTMDKLNKIADDFVNRNIFINQTSLVDQLLEDGFFEDHIENLYDIDPDDEDNQIMRDILQWIWVEDRMADKLRQYKEPILHNQYGTWWGRTTAGQAYSADRVIEDIALDMYKSPVSDEGHRND